MSYLYRFRVRFLGVLVLCAVLVTSCATTGPGGKKSLILIPTSQEVAIGRAMAEQVRQNETVYADSAWQSYLDEVGQGIAAVSDRRDLEWHFNVIQSNQINAFAAPGGFIYFYTGLLRHMDSEAELAAVMAHEISHVVARHGVKRLQAAMGAAMAYELVFGEEDSQVLQAAAQLGLGLVFSGYSRDAEREADQFGIHYMVKAGYHPSGAVEMFETLAELGGNRDRNVFEQLASTHPETQERIENAKRQISEMEPLSDDLYRGDDKYQRMKARLPGDK